jgi:hypothetical protein
MAFWKTTGMRLNWFGEFGHPFLTVSAEKLAACGIILHPGIPGHSDFVARLRQYEFAVVPMPSRTDEGYAWQGTLSFPSKLVTLMAACHLPVLYLGDPTSPGADFVRRYESGFVSGWDASAARDALARLTDPEERRNIRQRLVMASPAFSSEGLAERLWANIEGRASS